MCIRDRECAGRRSFSSNSCSSDSDSALLSNTPFNTLRFRHVPLCFRVQFWGHRCNRTNTVPTLTSPPAVVVCMPAHHIKQLSLIHIYEPTRQAEISYAVFCL